MKRLLASVALLALVQTPAQAQDASTVLATVDGVDITLGHVIAMGQRLPEQYQSLPDEVLYNGMIEQLIQQEVLAAEARKALSTAQAIALENEARALLAGDMIELSASADIAPAELQAAYDAQYATAAPEPEFNASHILVETEEEAAALITQLEGGADFAELAQEHSTGPSGPNGGQLGWFGLGMMVPQFETAVISLEAGQVSAPVQTQFGWHVVRLNEQREMGAPALIEVQGELEQALRSARVDAMVEELTAAADVTRTEVEIDPALIRNTDLLGD